MGEVTSYPLLNVFWTMFWLFLWILWIFLVIRVIMDVFRSEDMGGWAKAGWVALVVILPLFGVLMYLIARGSSMQARDVKVARAADEEWRSQVREAAGTSTTAELATLSDLHDRGVLTDAEFTREKEKILH